MTYEHALKALEERQETKICLGLERVRAHLRRLGDPQTGLRVIHVAGSNGKGSTCAILESVLRAAGYRTGLYTSPHLQEVRERIRVAGERIGGETFSTLLARAIEVDPKGELTYFELLTSIAFQHFARTGVEVAVLETGLGGRLDATNVVEHPLACAITSIGFDHEATLGKTLAAIAAEKAGIIKPGRPVVLGPVPEEARAAILSRAREIGAVVAEAGDEFATVSVDWSRGSQVLAGSGGRRFRLGLIGARQAANASVAWRALGAAGLEISAKAWREGLGGVRWPGRFQVLRRGPRTLIVDGAHNPEAAAHLAETLADSPWARGTRVFLGVLRDKDASGIVSALSPVLDEVVCCRPSSPRALAPDALARIVRRVAPGTRVRTAEGLTAALGGWCDSDGPAAGLVCGSLYLAGEALAFRGTSSRLSGRRRLAAHGLR